MVKPAAAADRSKPMRNAVAALVCLLLIGCDEKETSRPLPAWEEGATIRAPMIFDRLEKRCLPKILTEIEHERPILIFANPKEFPALSSKVECPKEVVFRVTGRGMAKVVPTFRTDDDAPTFGTPVLREVVRVEVQELHP